MAHIHISSFLFIALHCNFSIALYFSLLHNCFNFRLNRLLASLLIGEIEKKCATPKSRSNKLIQFFHSLFQVFVNLKILKQSRSINLKPKYCQTVSAKEERNKNSVKNIESLLCNADKV